MRGFISLKRQFRLLDQDQNGKLTQNEFLQAFDSMKITNVQSSELKMVFDMYDSQRTGSINYQNFLDDLITAIPEKRLKLVNEAFVHLDKNKNGYLELNELKGRFVPQRHPNVLSRLMNADEAQFEF